MCTRYHTLLPPPVLRLPSLRVTLSPLSGFVFVTVAPEVAGVEVVGTGDREGSVAEDLSVPIFALDSESAISAF